MSCPSCFEPHEPATAIINIKHTCLRMQLLRNTTRTKRGRFFETVIAHVIVSQNNIRTNCDHSTVCTLHFTYFRTHQTQTPTATRTAIISSHVRVCECIFAECLCALFSDVCLCFFEVRLGLFESG